MKIEAGYEPDDWLGELCQGTPVYDLTEARNIDNEWNRLHARLKQLYPTNNTGKLIVLAFIIFNST